MSSEGPTFSVSDFRSYLKNSEGLTLIGGQAVAWWEERYFAPDSSIVSRDIDFWTEREELEAFLKRSNLKAQYPHRYEMTVLLAVADIVVGGQSSRIEFLHTVPGLDTANRETVTMEQTLDDACIQVLDPISLALTKLHALRNFDQTDRLDALHLKVCIASAHEFLKEHLPSDPDLTLWHIERIAKAALQKRNRRVASEHDVNLLDAIPQSALREEATGAQHEKLLRFPEIRWPQIQDGVKAAD